jgi:hypothetical protein
MPSSSAAVAARRTVGRRKLDPVKGAVRETIGGEFGVRELIQSAMTDTPVVSIWFLASGGI